ncbi:MAG: CcdB family protein [Myxococcota bacterium]
MVTPRQFDVFRNPNAATARAVPWLLVIQADLLEDFPTRAVIPLVRPSALQVPASRLNPSFEISGERAILLTQQIGAVPKRSLKERVAVLADQRTKIIGAIDFLLAGA